jgi:hypothetical protein
VTFVFTIFPRADLIRKLGIVAPFSIANYQPENQLIQGFRRAYGERPTSPVHNAMQVQGMAAAAEMAGCAFAGGNAAQITLLGGGRFLAGPGVSSVATENPVVNAVLDAARQSASGRPGVIQSNGQAALVRSARSCMRRW